MQTWLQHRCFLVDIAKFLRIPILRNICQQLVLNTITQQDLSISNSNCFLSIVVLYHIIDVHCLRKIFVCLLDVGMFDRGVQKQPLEVSCKKVFLEISQNSQENTCARVPFLINFLYLKRDSGKGVFLWILWNF